MAKILDEHYNKLKEIFVTTDIPLAALSNQSKELIGVRVTIDQLKIRSTAEGWVAEKNNRQANVNFTKAKAISDEVDELRKVLYASIIAAGNSGVFVMGLELDPEKVENCLKKAGFAIDSVFFAPPKLNSAHVTAYMNILAKMNFNFDIVAPDRPSAKSTFQQVLEAMDSLDDS